MDLENICGWKLMLEKKKEIEPDYNPKHKPFYICFNKCDGYNKSCGGYYNEKSNKEKA